MISRNKGIFSMEFLVPTLGLVIAFSVVHLVYQFYVRPVGIAYKERRALVLKAPGGSASAEAHARPIPLIIMEAEPEVEIIFNLWGMLVLTYKFVQIRRERLLFKVDFIRVQPGERIIPDDALDRYKEIKAAVEREPKWHERLLPDCIMAALHRFSATGSIQDAATAVKERADLASDHLDSSLSLVRFIAWSIPAIGFVGTVRGIGAALDQAEEAIQGDISAVTSGLGLAFNSTFVGLINCIALMYVIHLVQSRQEAFIIETQSYCRDNLINVMKVPTKEEATGIYA